MRPDPHFLLLVTSTPSGVAGHHYSVRDIARGLEQAGAGVEVCLLVNKPGQVSRALDSLPHQRVDAGFFYLGVIGYLRRRLADDPALVIFGYDELCVRVAIAATIGERHRVVSVKPGWINSASWSNGVANFILFTRENLDYYQGHPRYAGVRIHYLPNRVAKPVVAPDAAARLQQLLPGLADAGELLFCPIRLGWGKAFIVEQALRLQQHLRASGKPVGLVIAGSVHDEDYVQSLRDRTATMSHVWVTTDATITKNISSYMNAFDLVIGAGRTTGEALCLGKRVFCPDPHGDLPAEITPESYHGLAYSNFTGRVSPVADAGEAREKFCDLSTLVAERLGVDAGVPVYRKIASDALSAKVGISRSLGTWAGTLMRLAAIYAKSCLTGLRGQPAGRGAIGETP